MKAGAQVDVEWVVAEVMRRLRDRAAHQQQSATDNEAASEPEPADGQLRIDQPVVTLAALGNELTGVRELVVPQRAVVTPAVRDVLRKRQIRLAFSGTARRAVDTVSRLVIGLAAMTGDAEAARTALAAETDGAEWLDAGGLVETVRAVVHAVRAQGRIGVLLTDRAAAAACLANRDPAVRAVWAASAPLVRQAAEQIGANLLVVDTSHHSVYELRSMVRAFAGASHCRPDRWQEAIES